MKVSATVLKKFPIGGNTNNSLWLIFYAVAVVGRGSGDHCYDKFCMVLFLGRQEQTSTTLDSEPTLKQSTDPPESISMNQ